jgi:GNAT superfamily N-acetyltransferase
MPEPVTEPPYPHRPSSGPQPRPESERVRVRLTRPEDIPGIIGLSRRIYGPEGAWLTRELVDHQRVFPEGQLVVVHRSRREIVGFAVSLLIDSRKVGIQASWDEITARGHLTTHDPQEGNVLYGAGIAVHPRARGMGVGRRLYLAREAMTERLGVDRIRAGARIPGYQRVADELDPFTYVDEVCRGIRRDPTLSFQLHMGFRVVGVALNYLPLDRDSLGHAAVVEWRRRWNPAAAPVSERSRGKPPHPR